MTRYDCIGCNIGGTEPAYVEGTADSRSRWGYRCSLGMNHCSRVAPFVLAEENRRNIEALRRDVVGVGQKEALPSVVVT